MSVFSVGVQAQMEHINEHCRLSCGNVADRRMTHDWLVQPSGKRCHIVNALVSLDKSV